MENIQIFQIKYKLNTYILVFMLILILLLLFFL